MPGSLHARVMEFGLLYFASYIAVRFGLPGDTFASAPNSYAPFAKLGTEEQWAMALGVLISNAALMMWFGGNKLRCIGCTILATVHSLVAILFFIGNPIGVSAGIYGGIAMLGYFSAWSAGREAA